MQKLVSVIIPIHNTAKYLKKCLNSVVRQTYTNLEIILINDGSTDKSAKIISDFAKQDSRIKVFTNETAQGVSNARNLGLDNARGEYVSFVDGDDWMPKTAIEKLLNAIVSNNADIAEGKFKTVGSNIKQSFSNKQVVYITETKNQKLQCLIQARGAIWGKLYKLDIINNNSVRFVNPIFEDSGFDFVYNMYSNSRVLIYEKVYYYNRIVLGGLSRTVPLKIKDYFEFALDRYCSNISEEKESYGFWNAIDSYLKVIIERVFVNDKETTIKNIKDVERILNNAIEKYELRDCLSEESYTNTFLNKPKEEIYNYFYSLYYSKKAKIKKMIKKLVSPIMYLSIFKLNWFYRD